MAFIADRLGRIKPSPTNAAQGKFLEMKAAGKDVIGLAAGEPDFPTPENIVEAAVRACRDPKMHKYTPAAGLPELRDAVAAKTLRDNLSAAYPKEVVDGRRKRSSVRSSCR